MYKMTDETKKQYEELYEKAIDIWYIACNEGVVALSDYADKRKVLEKDIFELGLIFISDGVSEDHMEKIFTNLIKQETEADKVFLKSIQKEAIMALRKNSSLSILKLLLNSFTFRTFKEDGIYLFDNLDERLNIKDAVQRIKAHKV